MVVSPANELAAFFFCAIAGMGAGFLFDLFRLFRYKKRRGTVRMGIEDGLFFLLAAALIFRVLLQKNDGAVRLYAWVAIALGGAAYTLFVSRFVFRGMVFIQRLIRRMGALILRVLLFPLRLLCRVLRRPLFAVISPVRLWGKKLLRGVKERCRSRQKRQRLKRMVWKKI